MFFLFRDNIQISAPLDGPLPGDGNVMQEPAVSQIKKMSAEEAEKNLLPPDMRNAETRTGESTRAAAKSRKKAATAADRTASAVKSVAKAEAATRAAFKKAESGHPGSALSRAAEKAVQQAEIAKAAAIAAKDMAVRAAALATRCEADAVAARDSEMASIKARARATGAEIELMQAERVRAPSADQIKIAKRHSNMRAKQAEACEIAAQAAVKKVAELATDARTEAIAAAGKAEEAAKAVKETNAAAKRAEVAARGRDIQTERKLANTTATLGKARKAIGAAADRTRASAMAAEKLEAAATAAHVAATSKADAERAALHAWEASDRAARAEAETGKNLRAPQLYLNRELTWLDFNKRVLHEAEDNRTPLLERVKFLAIVGGNIDEFFMKRIGGLKQQVGAGIGELTVDGRTPQDQIHDCIRVVREIQASAAAILLNIKKELQTHGIEIANYADLSDNEKRGVRAYYLKEIFPLVTPLAMDPAHPFPHISNLSLNLLVTLRLEGDTALIMARVKVPTGNSVPRFVRIGANNRFVLLEDVMANNLDVLFPDVDVMTCEVFRVTRNANTEREEEDADDLLEMIESEVRDRKFAPIVRLEAAKGIEPMHRGMLSAELGLNEDEDVFETDVLLGMKDLFEIASIKIADLHDPDHHAIDNVELDGEPNIFHAIRNKGPFLLIVTES
jgi:hypothetical protein